MTSLALELREDIKNYLEQTYIGEVFRFLLTQSFFLLGDSKRFQGTINKKSKSKQISISYDKEIDTTRFR